MDSPLRTPAFVLGVDGGGTKTVALLATVKGEVLGRGESGPSNYRNVGSVKASRAIRESVMQAHTNAGVKGGKAEIAVVALAAIDSRRDRAAAERFVRNAKIARKIIVIHDSKAALYAATRGDQGIIVISGTGCVAAGINKAGEYCRASGWGYLIDDEGSAYDIGRKALMSAYRAVDGRGPKTKLVAALKRRFRVKELENALGLIYSREFGVGGIAELARVVAEAARDDKVSKQLLKEGGAALAESACAVAKKLKMKNDYFPIVLVGGTYKAGGYLIDSFRVRIRQLCPHAQVKRLRIDPARGALMIALEAHRRTLQLDRRSQNQD